MCNLELDFAKVEEYRDAWITALDSDEYEQCQQRLSQQEMLTGSKSYCCLGVGALVVCPDHSCLVTGPYDETAGELPSDIQVALGLRDSVGYIDWDQLSAGGVLKLQKAQEDSGKTFVRPISLADLNDAFNWSFRDISKFIREERDAVFDTEEGLQQVGRNDWRSLTYVTKGEPHADATAD